MSKAKDTVKFTVIWHDARIRMGLTGKGSLLAYALADSIYHLSWGSGGWCIQSKQAMADWFGVDRTTIHRTLKKLMEMNPPLIERHPDHSRNKQDGRLRTTMFWYQEAIVRKQDTSRGETPHDLSHFATGIGGETPHNKNIDKNKIPPPTEMVISYLFFYFEKEKRPKPDDKWIRETVNNFFDTYEANGWMMGKNRMVDWTAAIRKFIRLQVKFDRELPSGGRRKGKAPAKFPDTWDSNFASKVRKEDYPRFLKWCEHLRQQGLVPLKARNGHGSTNVVNFVDPSTPELTWKPEKSGDKIIAFTKN